MYDVSGMFVPLVEAITAISNQVKYIIGTFTNIRAKGANISSTIMLSPYGDGGIPPTKVKGLLLPAEGSNKQYYCVGVSMVVPNTAYTPITGESWKASTNYTLMMQVNGVKCYRNNDVYYATLPSGEWMNKILTDIITRLDQIESLYNAHTHTGVTTGGDISGTVVVTMPDDSDLSADQNAINDGNTLITDDGTVP